MIENESPNFLTRFSSHLWSLQGYVYPALEKTDWLWKLELVEIPAGKISDNFFGGDKIISKHLTSNFSYIFIDLSNLTYL